MAFPTTFLFIIASTVAFLYWFSVPVLASYDQLNFWYRNVGTEMPKTISSKLSPLTRTQIEHLSSILNKNETPNNICSVARLACSPEVSQLANLMPLAKVYGKYDQEDIFKNEVEQRVSPYTFFRMKTLQPGNKVHLYDLDSHLPESTFLPYQVASKIPLVEEKLRTVFPESLFTSLRTKEAIDASLMCCNSPGIGGEMKTCTKSIEDMVQFAKSALPARRLLPLTSANPGSHREVIVGNHTKRIDRGRLVSCHQVFLPFATFLCHRLQSIHLYEVEWLETETNSVLNTGYSVCHMNTSSWAEDNVAFKLLQTYPGEGEVCHWVTHIDLAWLDA